MEQTMTNQFDGNACAVEAKRYADRQRGMPGGRVKALNNAFYSGALWQWEQTEAVRAEVERLKSEVLTMIEIAGNEHITRTMAQSDKRMLAQENNRLREALERISMMAPDEATYEAASIAREALT